MELSKGEPEILEIWDSAHYYFFGQLSLVQKFQQNIFVDGQRAYIAKSFLYKLVHIYKTFTFFLSFKISMNKATYKKYQ
jgi:hypothetical protein